MLYSLKQQGFYPEELKDVYEASGNWPNDGIEVSESEEVNIRTAHARSESVRHIGGKWVFTPAEVNIETVAAEARYKRDMLLKDCDYMTMPDYPLDDEGSAELHEYRQRLRDITEQTNFPSKIIWPGKPEFVK